MIDLGEAIARPSEHRRAAIAAGTVTIGALLVLPFAGISIGASTAALTVLATSVVTTTVTAMLLWAQARVTHSTPLLILAASYGVTVVLMVPATGAGTTSCPSLAWHLLLAAAPIAYVVARRTVRRRIAGPFARTQRIVVMASVLLLLVAFIVMPRQETLPAWTTVAGAAAVVMAALTAIGVLALQNRFASLLDMWLAVAALCTIVDIAVGSAFGPFTLGWYFARACTAVGTGGIMTALIVQIASVYARLARTAERLRSESLTDTLTGLTNRRGFDAQLAIAMGDGKRTARGAALLMIDLDNFKAYNDTFGHPAGDRALRVLAKVLYASVNRNRDVVARFGGEEFAIVMPETNLRGAAVVAERVRAAIERLGMPSGRAARHPVVTVSIGVAAVNNAVDSTPAAILADADRALYGAKQAGRNRVVAASPVRFAPVA